MHLVGTEPSGISQGLWPFFPALGDAEDLGPGPTAQASGLQEVIPPVWACGPFLLAWLGNQEAWAPGPVPLLACSFLHPLGFSIPALLWCRGGQIMQGAGEKVDREELGKGQVPPWDEMQLSCPLAWALT